MNRDDIIKELQKHDSTVLSFQNRGPWGDSRYRGNCSGWIQASLIWKYNVQKLAELFAGSGTGSDVAKDMQIKYIGADLNPNPLRIDILSVNAITDEVPMEFMDADMIFMHPPYGLEINIPYAGSMYKDPTKELSRSDLGQMPWEQFMKTLNKVVMKYYSSMAPGAKMSILMGNVRRNGRYYSMLNDIVKPGELVQTMVKIQHNCVSEGRTYSNRNFYPTDHEDILIIKKPSGYEIVFKVPILYKTDIRDSKTATWKDIVAAVMDKLGHEVSLDRIYDEIKDHDKCKANPNWQAKIRQTLQMGNFKNIKRGVWAAA